MANFTPQQHLAEVLSRYDDSPNPRLAEVSRSLISHLHAFVSEVGLTRDEWFTGIEALTKTGQMCDEERQEFILLSDTLGVSMLVEMISHEGSEGTTEPTVFGPFHVEDAPRREMGESIVASNTTDAPKNPMNDALKDGIKDGRPVILTGTVRDLRGEPIAGATLDVWSTAPNGFYDVQDAGQPSMNMRGIYTTGPDGAYEIHTVRPVAYSVPGDGPAGDLLFGNGRHNWRPAHVHFVVAAEGHKTVITHLFDAESDYLDSDAVFGVRDSLVVDMSSGTCRYDFVLDD